jgi:hypothetical protein
MFIFACRLNETQHYTVEFKTLCKRCLAYVRVPTYVQNNIYIHIYIYSITKRNSYFHMYVYESSLALTTQHPLSAKVGTTSPTSGGRWVGIVRSRTKATEFSLVYKSEHRL